MISKENLDARMSLSDDEKAKLTAEQIMSSSEQTDSGARSRNTASTMTVDLFHAAIKAWERVRDGAFDAKKMRAVIVMSPETYFAVALVGASVRQSFGRDAMLTMGEDMKTTLTGATADIEIAQRRSGTGPSRMSWGGIDIYPDVRIPYMAVGMVSRAGGVDFEGEQVFDAEKFADLQQDYATALENDEREAKLEAMDELASVGGQIGHA